MIRWLFAPALCLLLSGCWWASGPEVIVYTAFDSEFSKPVFADFTAAKFLRDEFAGG